jgi:hypothetical protein
MRHKRDSQLNLLRLTPKNKVAREREAIPQVLDCVIEWGNPADVAISPTRLHQQTAIFQRPPLHRQGWPDRRLYVWSAVVSYNELVLWMLLRAQLR